MVSQRAGSIGEIAVDAVEDLQTTGVIGKDWRDDSDSVGACWS
jgi:hypothetical protein